MGAQPPSSLQKGLQLREWRERHSGWWQNSARYWGKKWRLRNQSVTFPGGVQPIKNTMRRQQPTRWQRPEKLFSSDESEIWRGKATDIRKDGGEIAAIDAEPSCQGGEVLVNRRGRNPAAGAGVVRAVDGERGELAICPLTIDRTAKDQVMTAPAVVTALAVTGESTTKITGG